MLETGTQRDNWIDELNKTNMLLEYAEAHGLTEEAIRLRAKLERICDLVS